MLVMVFSFSIINYAESKDHSESNLESNGIESNSGPSDDYRLFQNFPNPFNPATIISYKLNNDGYVSLSVFNLVGQEVATLVKEFQEAGTYSKQFDASNLSAGVYLYKLQVNGFTSVKRMTLIK
ncbi:MAG: T9SS type A sorting domain-containing protein [Ignavibacteria bacterium]|nr:T9SS type A sorting domain-containing protein [Ignavibacteria bacterium]